MLIGRADLDPDVAYTIVYTLFQNADKISHAKAAELSLEFGASVTDVPYNEGAAATSRSRASPFRRPELALLNSRQYAAPSQGAAAFCKGGIQCLRRKRKQTACSTAG